MDFLQLVFGFVNAPLFATFLLGMFWKRTTGHGAFWGYAVRTRPRPADARVDRGRRQRRLARRPAPVPVVHGAEFLDRDLRLDHLPARDHRRQPGDQRPSRYRNCTNLVYGYTEVPHEDRESSTGTCGPLPLAIIVGGVPDNLEFDLLSEYERSSNSNRAVLRDHRRHPA